MHRKLAAILISFAILATALCMTSGMILAGVSEIMIDYAVANVNIPNVNYTRPVFRSVSFSGPNSVTWKDITTDVTIVRDEILRKTEKISVGVDEFTITMKSLPRNSYLFSFKGLSASRVQKTAGITSPGSQNASNKVEGGDLQMLIRFNVMNLAGIRSQLDDIAGELKRFSQEGVTKIPIQFSGDQKFILKGKPYTMKVWVEHENDEYRLVMDEKSLEQFGNVGVRISATKGDRKILAQNPLRLPQLLRIRDKAETMASIARRNDPNIPEDAYRHVLWSYLLTKVYGEEFARQVTDAHESEIDSEEMAQKGKRKQNASKYQDFHNNAIGRSYALKGYSESNILRLVLTDPDIIPDDQKIKKYDPAGLARYEKEAAQDSNKSK